MCIIIYKCFQKLCVELSCNVEEDFFPFFAPFQPWEFTAAVGNAVVNAVICGIYDDKKIAVVRFSIAVFFIFTTYIIVDYF